MQSLHVINTHGVYKLKIEKRCDGNRTRVTCYFLQDS